MKNIIYAVMLLLGLSIVGCQKEEPKPEPVKVTAVTLNTTSATLVEGETIEIVATISPNNADNKKILWTSSNSSIATVNEGKITAVKAGIAIITVTSDDGGKTATCNVTVKAKQIAVSGISLNESSVELYEGEDITLTATISPENASNKNISWSTNNSEVATVNDGKVSAIKSGTASIIVKTEDGGKSAECIVIVNEKTYAVESVSLDKTEIELTEGEKITLTATVKPENATNKNVTWSSDNTSVATVDAKGNVSAVKVGEALITVTTEDGEKTACCSILVRNKSYPLPKSIKQKCTGYPDFTAEVLYDSKGRLTKLGNISLEYLDDEFRSVKFYHKTYDVHYTFYLNDDGLFSGKTDNGNWNLSYSDGHLVKDREYYTFSWENDCCSSVVYEKRSKSEYEYFDSINPFYEQAFDILVYEEWNNYLNSNFGWAPEYSLGFCGLSSKKLVKSITGYSKVNGEWKPNGKSISYAYEYKDGLISKISVSDGNSVYSVYEIEY